MKLSSELIEKIGEVSSRKEKKMKSKLAKLNDSIDELVIKIVKLQRENKNPDSDKESPIDLHIKKEMRTPPYGPTITELLGSTTAEGSAIRALKSQSVYSPEGYNKSRIKEIIEKKNDYYLYSHVIPLTCLTRTSITAPDVEKYNSIKLENVFVVDVLLENDGTNFEFKYETKFYGNPLYLHAMWKAYNDNTDYPGENKPTGAPDHDSLKHVLNLTILRDIRKMRGGSFNEQKTGRTRTPSRGRPPAAVVAATPGRNSGRSAFVPGARNNDTGSAQRKLNSRKAAARRALEDSPPRSNTPPRAVAPVAVEQEEALPAVAPVGREEALEDSHPRSNTPPREVLVRNTTTDAGDQAAEDGIQDRRGTRLQRAAAPSHRFLVNFKDTLISIKIMKVKQLIQLLINQGKCYLEKSRKLQMIYLKN